MKKYLASLRVRILAELYILKTYFKQYPAFRRDVANDMAEAINAEMVERLKVKLCYRSDETLFIVEKIADEMKGEL